MYRSIEITGLRERRKEEKVENGEKVIVLVLDDSRTARMLEGWSCKTSVDETKDEEREGEER